MKIKLPPTHYKVDLKHKIIGNDFRLVEDYKPTYEIMEWCYYNCNHTYTFVNDALDCFIDFDSDQDALIFKLRWL